MLATPRSFSQPTTSFIASQCQGIRQTPLLCLISQLLFVSEDRSHDRSSARSVQGTTPTTKTALCSTYPFLPLRLGDGARKSRLQTSLSDEQCQRTIRCRKHRVSLHLSDGVGGGRRDRTDDLLLAKQALSQLSYAPVERLIRSPRFVYCRFHRFRPFSPFLARTPFSARTGLPERSSRSRERWWAREDLNLRPHAYQARALTS